MNLHEDPNICASFNFSFRNGNAYKVTYIYGTTPYTLAFNLCGYTPNTSKCDGNQDFGTLTYSDSCKSLTGSSLNTVSHEYYDQSNHTAGISLTYSLGEKCPHSDAEFYQLSVSVVCDTDGESNGVVKIDQNSLTTPCSPRAVLYSSLGCPAFEANPVFQWMYSARFVMGPIAGILGLYLMTMSFYFRKTTYFLAGLFSTPVIILGILYGAFISDDSKAWIVSIPLGLSILIGFGVGY